VEMSANDIWLLDLTDASKAPMTIDMRRGRCTRGPLEELRGVLRNHPGSSAVRLRLIDGKVTTTFRLADELKVTQGQPLMADLKALLGPSCVPRRQQ
ncbi:hypothetical protein BGU99_18945, partial [Clostridioides difficile]